MLGAGDYRTYARRQATSGILNAGAGIQEQLKAERSDT